jgi:hypothetical protein
MASQRQYVNMESEFILKCSEFGINDTISKQLFDEFRKTILDSYQAGFRRGQAYLKGVNND